MKYIVGLGNPGAEYAGTRHNAGFLALDTLAESLDVRFQYDRTLEAETARVTVNGIDAILLKPQTFMNESGRTIRTLIRTRGLEPKDLIVVFDDKDIPFGEIRVRHRGSSGGHRGARSIMDAIGEGFTRVRIGTANEHTGLVETSTFVLRPFSAQETQRLPKLLKDVSEAITKITGWIPSGSVSSLKEDRDDTLA